jgi:hypothetical protein
VAALTQETPRLLLSLHNQTMIMAVNRRVALAWATLLGCSGCAAAAPGAEAANEFRTLRSVRGHFDGSAWNDDVDRWQGRKHVAMQRLAQQLLDAKANAAQVRRAMGEPDARLTPGGDAYQQAIAQAQWRGTPGGVLWLYRWRGTHDQLALAVEHDRVVATGWLHQWE